MIRAEHVVDIERPVEEVFDYVSDQTNEPRWHTDVLEVDPKQPVHLGSKVTWLVKFMGTNRYVSEVTGFEPHRRIELTATEGPLKPTLTHRFEPANGGTRYTRRVEIPLEGFFRLVGPIMKASGAAHKRNARFAENLKDLLNRPDRP
ncbi:MAG: SRPBCC family protein [Acidimicrobiia bacterium]